MLCEGTRDDLSGVCRLAIIEAALAVTGTRFAHKPRELRATGVQPECFVSTPKGKLSFEILLQFVVVWLVRRGVAAGTTVHCVTVPKARDSCTWVTNPKRTH